MGYPGAAPQRLPRTLQLPAQARARAHEEGLPALAWPSASTSASSGSGFGGSITAWRLAELYTAAGVDPKNILVLERGRRFKHTDFTQSMYDRATSRTSTT